MSINADPYGLPEGGTVTTGQLVISVAQTGTDNGFKCLETLTKVVCNAVGNPSEPKYRELRRGPALEQVEAMPPAATLLRRLGFQDVGDRYRLQTSGVRGPEVARFQCAMNDLPHCSELVVRLAPAIDALGLYWSKPDGTITYVPGPSHSERMEKNREMIAPSMPQRGPEGLWTSGPGVNGATRPASAEEEDDADLQEALRLSMIES
mmetsp:Transcript_48891/g.91621  ORF Transcript_48891/g.91621 Transcript_48891/m.91621 type:complete len:207 (-) Transcript_48891:111-731(-)